MLTLQQLLSVQTHACDVAASSIYLNESFINWPGDFFNNLFAFDETPC